MRNFPENKIKGINRRDDNKARGLVQELQHQNEGFQVRIKMVEDQEAEFTSLHGNIENTSTSGTIQREQLWSADRRSQMSEKTQKPPHNWVGQKEKRKRRNQNGTCTPGREL